MSGSDERQDDADAPRRGTEEIAIARDLTGDLLCARCRYNLQGLSIRALCPECRMPVRATILAVVDPRAAELAPVRAPRTTALALIVWSVGAVFSAMCVWWLRIAEIGRGIEAFELPIWWAPDLGVIALVVSALGGIAIIRPFQVTPSGATLRAALAIGMYVPLAIVYWEIYGQHDALSPDPFFERGGIEPARVALRLAAAVLISIIVLGLRPNLRTLSDRSVLMRTGRVDRQNATALIAALAVASVGDVLHLVTIGTTGWLLEVFFTVRVVLIAVGSVLFTIGLWHIMLDTIRLYPVIVAPGVGLADILQTNEARDRAGDGAGDGADDRVDDGAGDGGEA